MKCTGGPPNEVKPRYHVSLTVFQSRGPKFEFDMVSHAQVLGDQRGLMPMVGCWWSVPGQVYNGVVQIRLLGRSAA